MIKPQGN